MKNLHTIFRLTILTCLCVAGLPIMCATVNAQSLFPPLFIPISTVTDRQNPLLNHVQLKCENASVLNKIDSLLIIENQDTSLTIIKTDFTYNEGYLIRIESSFHYIGKGLDDPNYHFKGATNFIYNNQFNHCIANDVTNSTNNYTFITISKLNLNDNGFIDSGEVINLHRYLYPIDSNTKGDYSDKKIKMTIEERRALSIDEKSRPFKLLIFDWADNLFRNYAIANFFRENIGFPNLTSPLLQQKDFLLPQEEGPYHAIRWGEKDQFLEHEGTTVQVDKKTRRFISAYHSFPQPSSKPYSYLKFYYYNHSLVIEKLQFNDTHPQYENLIGPFFDILRLSTDNLEKIDHQFKHCLKTYISERVTIRFRKDGNITGYLLEDFKEVKTGVKRIEIEYGYDGDLLSKIIFERWDKNLYLKKSTNLVYNKKHFP